MEVGYEHLAVEEKQQLKEALSSEATFFMKGKYPKVIRTELEKHVHVLQASGDLIQKSRRS